MNSQNKGLQNWVQNGFLILLALMLIGVIFAVDINVTMGVAIGAMYSIVILYSWVLPKPITPAITGVVCSILIMIVFVEAPHTDEIDHTFGANRLISLLVVWVCVSMMTIAKRSFEQVELSKQGLEEKIQERTQKLELSQASLIQAQSVAKIGSWEWFPDTNKVTWSDEMFKIFGIDKAESTGFVYDIYPFIHPEDVERVKETSAEAAASKKAIPIEYRVLTRDNQLKYVRGDGDSVLDEAGNLVKLFGTIQDITDNVNNQQQLQKYAQSLETKNKELEQFAYIASHDLQEPLRTLMSMSTLFEQKYQGKLDDQANKFLRYISEASKRMSALVKGLMEYSRIGKEKSLTTVDCNAILEEVKTDLATKIEETNTRIESTTLPKFKGYKTELRLLFQNLISNAIKFQSEGSKPIIKINAIKRKGEWLLSFEDNGIGIAENHIDRIFTIFQRLHSKSEYDGTGIGLAHCQKIIELHGGKIWVESEIGKGSTFFLAIPI